DSTRIVTHAKWLVTLRRLRRATGCPGEFDPRASLSRRERKADDEVSPSPASIASTGSDRDELFAVDHVDGRRGEDPGAGVELPQQVSGLCIISKEVPRDIAARSHEHQPSSGDDGTGLAVPFKRSLPHQFSRRRVESGKVSSRGTAGSYRAVDTRNVEK